METIILNRAICWKKPVAQETPAPSVPAPVPPVVEPVVRGAAPDTLGRPHATVNFTRPLTEHEEAIIQVEFLKLNGIFEPLKKDCTRILGLLGKEDLTVFQVSGHVCKLHRMAQSGELELRDRAAYLKSLQARREHQLTYNGPKWERLRQRAETEGRKPSFAARPQALTPTKARHRMVQ